MAKEKVTDGHGLDVEILPTANLCHRSVWRTAVDSTRAVSVRIALSLQLEAFQLTQGTVAWLIEKGYAVVCFSESSRLDGARICKR